MLSILGNEYVRIWMLACLWSKPITCSKSILMKFDLVIVALISWEDCLNQNYHNFKGTNMITMRPLFVMYFLFFTRYYCVLVPLTLPILYAAVYFHWLSMKLFKHAWRWSANELSNQVECLNHLICLIKLQCDVFRVSVAEVIEDVLVFYRSLYIVQANSISASHVIEKSVHFGWMMRTWDIQTKLKGQRVI